MRREILGALTVLLAAAGLWLALSACDSDKPRGDSSDGDSDSDSDTEADECADYRTVYPGEPYGTAVGDVIADFPGMVDGEGNTVDLFGIFQDTSVVAIAVCNAFDT